MKFANPLILLVCLLIPPVIFLSGKLENRLKGSFRFSDKGRVKGIGQTWRVFASRKVVYLRALSLLFIAAALARPQEPIEETKIFVEGVDIVLAIDTSGSMKAMDFEIGRKRYSRLEVVKTVLELFIPKRPNDRIGIVAFASSAYTVCPLTLDHDWLLKNLERVKIGMIEDGTSIGSAIGAAINRIKKTDAKDKVIILLTDGLNNAGKISPLTAAEAAKALGIRIYCIGAGTKGLAPYPVKNVYGRTVLKPMAIEIDEKLLREVSMMTGGKYFRATDTGSLMEIYDEIDELEKTEMEEVGFMKYNELFGRFLFFAVGLLLFEIVIANTLLRRIP